MNNTIKTLPAIAAILIAATLVVGTAGTVTTKTAFAASNNSGNTVTIEECKNKGSASGFDTTTNQECENLICTHPGSGATCVSEGSQVTPGTGTLLVKKIVECKADMTTSILQDKCPEPKDFKITVTGNHPDPASFDGSSSGTLVTLGIGPYKVTEDELKGFDPSFSADCNGTIAPGDQKTCTITNTEEED
jgi:hypothetical protein